MYEVRFYESVAVSEFIGLIWLYVRFRLECVYVCNGSLGTLVVRAYQQ